MAETINLNLSEQVCKWFDEHPLFKVAGMCEIIGLDAGNFNKYRKMKVIPPKHLAACIEIINNYGWRELIPVMTAANMPHIEYEKNPLRETHKPLSAKPFLPIEQVHLKNERCNFIPKGKEELQKEIAVLKAEKIPKERDTVLGRKIWQREQHEKIRHLSTLIN